MLYDNITKTLYENNVTDIPAEYNNGCTIFNSVVDNLCFIYYIYIYVFINCNVMYSYDSSVH